MKKIYVTYLFFLLLDAQIASAVQGYAGAGLIRAHAADAANNVNSGLQELGAFGISSNASFNQDALGASLYGGVDLNPYVAAEAGFMYLGSYDFDGNFSGGGLTTSLLATDTVAAFYGAGLLRYPFTPLFGAFLKVGFAETTNSESCSIQGGACDGQSTSGISPLFGIGVTARAARNLDGRVEFDQIDSVGDSNQYTGGDFQVINVSFSWLFR